MECSLYFYHVHTVLLPWYRSCPGSAESAYNTKLHPIYGCVADHVCATIGQDLATSQKKQPKFFCKCSQALSYDKDMGMTPGMSHSETPWLGLGMRTATERSMTNSQVSKGKSPVSNSSPLEQDVLPCRTYPFPVFMACLSYTTLALTRSINWKFVKSGGCG